MTVQHSVNNCIKKLLVFYTSASAVVSLDTADFLQGVQSPNHCIMVRAGASFLRDDNFRCVH